MAATRSPSQSIADQYQALVLVACEEPVSTSDGTHDADGAGAPTAGQTSNHPALAELARFPQSARLLSVDPTRNRYRFYALTWQPTLWGGGALVRSWGRLGTPGRSLTAFYPDRDSAQELIVGLLRRRLQHGYRVVAWQ